MTVPGPPGEIDTELEESLELLAVLEDARDALTFATFRNGRTGARPGGMPYSDCRSMSRIGDRYFGIVLGEGQTDPAGTTHS